MWFGFFRLSDTFNEFGNIAAINNSVPVGDADKCRTFTHIGGDNKDCRI
jgi:hypothetical protein